MWRSNSITAAALTVFALGASAHALAADRLAGLATIGKTCGVPQVGIFGDVTTILANMGTRLYFKVGDGAWSKAPIDLDHAHSLARLPNGRWLINDTDHHRLVQLDDLSGTGRTVARSTIAGITLRRPHDQLVDPVNRDIYVIAGDRHLFRFKDLEGPIDVWTFTPEELGYVRALSWFDGRLHIVNSSRGEVLRIDSYAEHRYTRFRSPRPAALRGKPSTQIAASESRDDFDAGSLSTTGLILNDVEKHGDWYYATNDFLVDYALGGDTGPARLIRWRSWADFEQGRWQDLSSYIPKASSPLVPYFITIHDNVLYTPLQLVPDEKCDQGSVLQLDLETLSPTVHAAGPPAPVDGGFTLAVLPDTQNYTWQRPELYTLQTGWLAANADRYHLAYVLHVGDITQHNNREEWEVARRAHLICKDAVPSAFASGNHDLGPNGETANRDSLFSDYITLADYRRHSGFGGVYDKEPTRTENSYHLFDAGGRQWLILALEFGPRDDVVRWANDVVARHRARSVILVTHAYLFSDGTRYEGSKQQYSPASFPTARSPAGSNDGEALWRKLVSRHRNFALVVSGHVGISAHLESKGEHGNTVHQIVVDYQNVDNGGNGWLRLLQFQPDGQTVTVRDYSPLLNEAVERETFVIPR